MNFSVDFYSFIHRLFEDAADKLNLMALAGFLYQLKKASQAQLFHSVTDTVDYSLAMPGRKKTKKQKTQTYLSHIQLYCLQDQLCALTVLIFPLEISGYKENSIYSTKIFPQEYCKVFGKDGELVLDKDHIYPCCEMLQRAFAQKCS